MASSKLMASNNSDLSSRHSATSSSSSTKPLSLSATTVPPLAAAPRSVEDVWREIVSGDAVRECKEEAPDEMMTLEDFLARAGAAEEEEGAADVKVPPAERLGGGAFALDLVPFPAVEKVEGSVIGFGNGVGGRGKRARPVLEPLDKAAQQRQRRMIKNRESAARSRERKQAYQVELESLAVKLEEEKEMLLKEKEKLLKNVVTVNTRREGQRRGNGWIEVYGPGIPIVDSEREYPVINFVGVADLVGSIPFCYGVIASSCLDSRMTQELSLSLSKELFTVDLSSTRGELLQNTGF